MMENHRMLIKWTINSMKIGRLSKQSTNWMQFHSKFRHHSPEQIGKKAENSQRNTKDQLVKKRNMLEVLTIPDSNMYHTGMVIQTSLAQAFNLSTQEEGMGRFLWAWGQPCVLNEVQASRSYKVRPCVKKKTRTKAETEINDGTRRPRYKPRGHKMFLQKSEKYSLEQTVFSTNIASKTIYSGRIKLALFSSPHKKTNSKQIKDLNATSETQNLVSTK